MLDSHSGPSLVHGVNLMLFNLSIPVSAKV